VSKIGNSDKGSIGGLVIEDPQLALAIVGYSCRFPKGANSPSLYWKNLLEGKDCIQIIPNNRWDSDSKDKRSAKYVAGLIDDIDKFDADFFGIFPREAASMDPQQRLLLEISWEALEHAGIRHEHLLGSNTGVFIGSVALDYRDRFTQMSTDHIDTYALTGNLLSILSGRLSYVLGLEGPCLTIETACSSSLVAVHQACQNLRLGECDLAIAGGVNVLLSPVGMELLDKAKTLSNDGKCWAFDEKANGLVRGEGCGIVILKRLEDAKRDNDRIIAVIRGGAINHDGKAASLSSPNVLAQQSLLKKALKDSGLNAQDVGYVETHGTGTALGDPIEIQAIKEIYGDSRDDGSRCYLSSVKSNIGHLEGAAGIAGMIKAILALENNSIPPQINFETLNPVIDIDNSSLQISKELIPWKSNAKKKRVAGVSSFGISGTNAHVLIEESPYRELLTSRQKDKASYNITLSAKNPETLTALAQKYIDELQDNSSELATADLQDISYSTQLRRSHYKTRLSITATTKEELKEALQSYVKGTPYSGLRFRDVPLRKNKIAFVFPGLGAQWDGMGSDLFQKEPVFQEAILLCEEIVQDVAGWSLMDKLNFKQNSNSNYIDIPSVQINMFAINMALVKLWESWGITPRAVVGHSLGEVSAAHASGLIDLPTAIKLVYYRAKILEQLQDTGSMAIIGVSWEKAVELVDNYKGLISVAGANSPRLTLLSGDTEKLQELWEKCHKNQIFFRMVKNSAPSHSALLDPFLPDLREKISSIQALESRVSFYSAWQTKLIKSTECDSEYWIKSLRQPVLFDKTISQMLDDGFTNFVEISPHPTLQPAINEIAQQKSIIVQTSSSLREGINGRQAMLESLSELYVSGINIDWEPHHTSGNRQYVRLPSYPWQKERHWVGEKTTYFKNDYQENDNSTSRTSKVDDELFLHVSWKESDDVLPFQAEQGGSKSWLLLSADTPNARQVRAAMESRGYQVIQAAPKDLLINDKDSRINPLDMRSNSSFINLFNTYFNDKEVCAGVIHMLNFSNDIMKDEDLPQEALDLHGCTAIMYLMQTINQLSVRNIPSLFLITNNARTITPIDNINNVIHSSLWGMAQSLRYEFPDIKCKCIDLSSAPIDEEIEALISEILAGNSEEQVAYRSNKRYVGRLRKGFPSNQQTHKKVSNLNISKEGTYVISGGLGGLGLELAKWLAKQGASSLVLLSRSGPKNTEQQDILSELSNIGVVVKTPKVDISDYSMLASTLENLEDSFPPIKGIIHAAGTLEDGFLVQQSHENFRKVFAPKVDGALNLHRFSKKLNLDFFIMYSSASTTVGSPGQTNYSAANACLDALAHYRVAQGLPALSINWGAFKDVGLATANSIRAERLERRGVRGINFEMSLHAIELIAQSGTVNIGFMPFEVRQWTEFYPQASSSTYLSELINSNPRAASKKGDLIEIVTQAPKGKKLAAISYHVQDLVASILHQDPKKLGLEMPFSNFGMDSLTGLELRNRLEVLSGHQLPATLIWTYTNITALAQHLLSLIAPEEDEANKSSSENWSSQEDVIEYLKQELSA